MRSGATDQGLGVSTRIERNMCALLEYRRREEGENLRSRVADSIGRLTGITPFIYIHFVVFGLWIVINLGLTPVNPFDPRFVALAMVTSVEAFFVLRFCWSRKTA
jgi:uncharacterized membrane protein